MTVRTLIILLFLAATPAFAAPDASEDVWKEISNYKGWPVDKLVLEGVEKGAAKELRKGLFLAGKDAVLYEQRLREDIDRITLFLARRGYPYARVAPDVEADAEKRRIKLIFDINPGPPVIVGKYRIVAIPEKHRGRIESQIRVRPGDVFVDERLAEDIEAVIAELQSEGHAYAQAGAAFDWIDTTTVDIKIGAVPGPVRYFRNVTVEGVTEDLAQLAHTLVDIRKGERYNRRTMRDARDHLSRTGLFRQIRLNMVDVPPDTLDLKVELQERKPRTIETAVGYWSDERFSGRIRWQHRNIFRRGRGMLFEVVYTQFRQWGEWVTWWPALFSMKKSIGTFRLGINSENEANYELLAPTIGVSYGYNFTRTSSATLSANLSRASYTIKTTEAEFFQDPEGLVGWLETRLSRDGTDDRISPSKGTFSWLRFEWGPRGGVSESNWILGEGNATHMLRLRGTAFAINLHLGLGKPIEPSDVLLPDRRFYAGGSVDNRGFNRRKLGPKDINGAPVGGEVLALGFFEYRFPIAWKFNGAVFVDWGQVWQTRADVNNEIEIAVGPALRLMTPVGPLRLDWGYRLTDYDKVEPKWALHFAIGYPM